MSPEKLNTNEYRKIDQKQKSKREIENVYKNRIRNVNRKSANEIRNNTVQLRTRVHRT